MSWSIRGNFVHATEHPFRATASSRPASDASPQVRWLGPGLCLLIDHVLTVDSEGYQWMMKEYAHTLFNVQQLARNRPWLLDPVDEVKKTLTTEGIYPTVKVDASRLLSSFQADSLIELEKMIRVAFAQHKKPHSCT